MIHVVLHVSLENTVASFMHVQYNHVHVCTTITRNNLMFIE